MRWIPSQTATWALALLALLAALAAAVPVPEPQPAALADALANVQAQMPLELQERLRALQLDEQQLEQVTRDKRTISILRSLFPGVAQNELNPEENQLAGAESQVSEVRAQYTDDNPYATDQDAAASGGNDGPDAIAVPLEDETAEDADRSKRQFSIGGGSGGGSGNFLFDIIRLVSGGSSGGGATHEASTDGSGGGAEKDEGYGAGVPGPVTRLFVIANRGIANLVQDLILRIAQTSERLVNFKARLITSII